MTQYNLALAKMAGVAERLKAQVKGKAARAQDLERRILANHRAGNMELAGTLARELQELKADLTTDTAGAARRPKRPTRSTCARRRSRSRSSRTRSASSRSSSRRSRSRKRRPKRPTALSSVAFKVGDLGDTMKTVEEILQKRYEVSAGKARVAKDMVDMEARSRRRRTSARRSSRWRWPSSSPARASRRRRRLKRRRRRRPRRWDPSDERPTAVHRARQARLDRPGRSASIALGVYMVLRGRGAAPAAPATATEGDAGGAAEVAEVKVEVPKLSPPAPFQFKDNIVPIEISEYAGYAGLIAANGGLEPTENSRLLQEPRLQGQADGQRGRELVGAERGQDRGVGDDRRRARRLRPAAARRRAGADRLLARRRRRRRAQRHQAHQPAQGQDDRDGAVHRGRLLHPLPRAGSRARRSTRSAASTRRRIPIALNLVYTEDGFGAGDLFLRELKSGKNRLAGCVTWEPKVSEVVEGSGGKAHVLTTNRNLLIVADVLIVHRGFAEQQPEDRRGPRAGPARRQPHGARSAGRSTSTSSAARSSGRATTRRPSWRRCTCRTCRRTSRSSPGAIDAAGSFGGIYQSAVLAYGSDLIKDPPDAEPLRRRCGALQALEKGGLFKEQKVAIAPIRSGGGASLETDPLLSKDIRFLFEPNSATLDLSNQENIKNLEAIKKLLQVSPGSTMLLRGHVDNARVAEFRAAGRRGLRAHAGAARDGAEQEPRGARSGGCSIERYSVDPKRHRRRRPRLGRAGRPEFGPEPPRRSAVVHDRVVIDRVRGSGRVRSAWLHLEAPNRRRCQIETSRRTRTSTAAECQPLRAAPAPYGKPAASRARDDARSLAAAAALLLSERFRPCPARRRAASSSSAAGFSGLAAAYELSRAGYDVTVVEARNRVGGRVISFSRSRAGQERRGRRRADRLEPSDVGRLRQAVRARVPRRQRGGPRGADRARTASG